MADCLEHSCANSRFLPLCGTPLPPPNNAAYWILRNDRNTWCVHEGGINRKGSKITSDTDRERGWGLSFAGNSEFKAVMGQ